MSLREKRDKREKSRGERVLTSSNGTKSNITLLLLPLNEQGSERHAKVHDALRRAGADVKTLAELLDWSPGSRTPIPQPRVCMALQQARQVVLLPRADASIGSGTYRDIGLARDLALPVYVVANDGKLVPLDRAGLEVVANPSMDHSGRRIAARFTWPSGAVQRRTA